MDTDWKIKIRDVGYKTSLELYVFRRNFSGGTDIMYSDKIETHQEGAIPAISPTLQLTPEVLQELANELDRMGYKPLKGFVEGKLEATENHLKDLRQLLKLK